MKDNPSIAMIEIVAKGLGSLVNDVVFVGGATTGIYIDDPGSPEPRATEDVDCIVEVATRNEYYALEKQLRQLGFKEDISPNAPACRKVFKTVVVDVMPTDPKVLGFTNRWYEEGIATAQEHRLPSGLSIRVFSFPYFIASKLEAFKDRGQTDFRFSSDLEDIISVLEGAKDAEAKIMTAPPKVQEYLKIEFSRLVGDERFREAVIGHLQGGNSFQRVWSMLERIR